MKYSISFCMKYDTCRRRPKKKQCDESDRVDRKYRNNENEKRGGGSGKAFNG